MWGISRLDEWSSMQVFSVVARAPRVPGPVGVRVTRMNQGFFRSAFVGQANAVLVSRSLAAEDRGHLQISDPGRERRIVQAVGVAGRYVIANLHANRGAEVAPVETERSRAFAEAASRPGEVIVLAGRFQPRGRSLARLLRPDARHRPHPRQGRPGLRFRGLATRTARARRRGSLRSSTGGRDDRGRFY